MSFDPSGLPTLPTCESDIARWAADLQTWLVTKLTTAHNEIDGITVDPFDICTEVGNLSAPTCLVPATGIDTEGFTYATETGTVGPGVLPWPGSVMESGRFYELYEAGISFDAATNWTAQRVDFPVPLPSADYFVNLESNNYNKMFFTILSKDANGFTMAAASGEPSSSRADVRWSALYYGPEP